MVDQIFSRLPITTELICETLQFCERNEIEKSQLISQRWNAIVLRHENQLPLRLARGIHYNENKHEVNISFYAKKKIELHELSLKTEYRKHTLRTVVFGEMSLYIEGMAVFLDKLRLLVEECGSKIYVRRIRTATAMTKSIYEREIRLDLYQLLFNDLILTSEALLQLNLREFQDFLSNPKRWEIIKFPKTTQILEDNSSKNDINKVMKFIELSNFNHHYEFNMELNETFLKDYLEVFLAEKNPNRLIKKILVRIYFKAKAALSLFLKKIDCIHGVRHIHSSIKKHEIQRPDGWNFCLEECSESIWGREFFYFGNFTVTITNNFF